MKFIALAIAAFTLASSGCAVQGEPFQRVSAPATDSVIYVYRPYHYEGSLLKPAITCGDESARIGAGGYHAFVVPGEAVKCSVETETKDEIEIGPEPRTYYIREEFGWGKLIGHPHLSPIDADKAQREIQECCVREHD